MFDGDALIEQAARWPALVPGLLVADLERSVETYTRLFGFETVHTDLPRRAVLSISGAPVVLTQHMPDADDEPSAPLGKGVTLHLRVGDPKQLYESLRDERYPMAVPMEISEVEVDGERVQRAGFAVQDADGHVLSFSD